MGENATFNIKVNSEDVKYAWYFKDANSSTFSKSSIKSASYSVSLTKAVTGREIYCVIIKDAFGNEVTADIVTLLEKADNYPLFYVLKQGIGCICVKMMIHFGAENITKC